MVKDATRGFEWAAVPGAECMLLSNAGIFLRAAKSLTNSYGVAIIEDVQPGYYQEIVSYKPYSQRDFYHRYDLVKYLEVGSIIEDKPIASLSNTSFPASLSRSNYFLSSSCFNDPYMFENMQETLAFVEHLSDYVDGIVHKSPIPSLKKGVLVDIRLTREIEKCWNRKPMHVIGSSAAWRYIATNSGAMRQYPGRQTYNNRYDPTTRPWYYAAKSYPGNVTFSVPYLDNGGAGVVVTTSQTISSDSMVRKWSLMVTSAQVVQTFHVATDESPPLDYFKFGIVRGNLKCGYFIMAAVPNTNVCLVVLDGGDCPNPAIKCTSCSKKSCADGITKDMSLSAPIWVPCLCSVPYSPCALHYYRSPNAAVACPSIRRSLQEA
ncbi:VWFA and cache domain-containing protein 1 [Stylophora pistillata]|uniref:VWFA and cache domain-containing protein 1 n=1 Tax=Stylophora pistillata TaxID=50429 RepID=A0A2B4SLY5_STYPI|nr:VWFA and cache domain-containing protein 1 [Stylophora pistillata]